MAFSFDGHANFAVSTVATAPSPATSGTSLTVASGNGVLFPAVPFNATVWPVSAFPSAANAEIVRVTVVSGDVLTITRAQEGTSAQSVDTTYAIAAAVTAKSLTDIQSNLVDTTTGQSVGGVKTFTSSPVLSGGSVQLDVSAGSTDPFKGQAAVSYTPTWGSTGTAPAIGNGSIKGTYIKVGRLVQAWILHTNGSTTTYGTGALHWSLPFSQASTNSIGETQGSWLGAPSAGSVFAGISDAVGSTVFAWALVSAASGSYGAANQCSGTIPAAWASTGTMRISITYEATT